MQSTNLDSSIFREYDIRGVVGEGLTEDVVERIGLAFAECLHKSGSLPTVLIGGDARPSSEPFLKSLAEGLQRGGVHVIDIGQVATPVLYFAIHHWNIPNGIVVTGSHNPVEYNGLKLTKDYSSFAGNQIQELAQLVRSGSSQERSNGEKSFRDDAIDDYQQALLKDVKVKQPVKVVVDCGNGITGAYVPELYRQLGCEVVPLYAEVDGTFPNHHPDPTRPENLVDLIRAVKDHNADVGIAFDGDGDRVGVVTNTGETLWIDRLLAFFSRELIQSADTSGQNAVVFDVKCSQVLQQAILNAGGKPMMWKTGHTHIKQKIKSENAILGGEFSGHICFCDRWPGFDDGPYAGARILEVLGNSSASLQELFKEYPQKPSTPELFIDISDDKKFVLIEKLQTRANFAMGEITHLDGVRVDFEDGFGLIRASNTSPKLTLRFEGDSQECIERIHAQFEREVRAIDESVTMPELDYV